MRPDNKRRKMLLVAAAAVCTAAAGKYLLPVYRVTGNSMETALPDGSIVVCPRSLKVRKGDVTAFRHEGRVLVKRLAAVAGDVAECYENGAVRVNGRTFGEPDIDICGEPFSCVVPRGRVFLLGDNRAVSIDSRSPLVGLVSKKSLIGRAALLITPWGEIRKL